MEGAAVVKHLSHALKKVNKCSRIATFPALIAADSKVQQQTSSAPAACTHLSSPPASRLLPPPSPASTLSERSSLLPLSSDRTLNGLPFYRLAATAVQHSVQERARHGSGDEALQAELPESDRMLQGFPSRRGGGVVSFQSTGYVFSGSGRASNVFTMNSPMLVRTAATYSACDIASGFDITNEQPAELSTQPCLGATVEVLQSESVNEDCAEVESYKGADIEDSDSKYLRLSSEMENNCQLMQCPPENDRDLHSYSAEDWAPGLALQALLAETEKDRDLFRIENGGYLKPKSREVRLGEEYFDLGEMEGVAKSRRKPREVRLGEEFFDDAEVEGVKSVMSISRRATRRVKAGEEFYDAVEVLAADAVKRGGV